MGGGGRLGRLWGLLGMWKGRNCQESYVVGLEDGQDVWLAGSADDCRGDRDSQLPSDDEPMRIDDCLSGRF